MNFINYIFFYILHTQINLQNFQDIVLLLKTHSFVFKYLLIFFFIIFQYINLVLSFILYLYQDISAEGMKVIQQFHLEDLLRKKEERAKREAKKKKRKNIQNRVTI